MAGQAPPKTAKRSIKKSGMRWKAVALRAERRLTGGLVDHRRPAWSLDGERLVFAAGGPRDAVWVVTDRRGRVARVLPGPAAGSASFGPDDAIAFGRSAGGFGEVWYTPGGAAPAVRLLGGDGAHYHEPALSPDGGTLAFVRRGADGAGSSQLHLLDVKRGARLALPSDPARRDAYPAFSPDGQELFFEGAHGDDVAVYAWAFAGGDVVRVTPEGAPSRRPAPLSLDLVVVERQEGERRKLVLVDCAGGRERELTSGKADQREPSVARTGSGKVRLAFAQLTDGHFEICQARVKAITLAADLTVRELPDFPPATDDLPPQPEVAAEAPFAASGPPPPAPLPETTPEQPEATREQPEPAAAGDGEEPRATPASREVSPS